MNLYTVSFFGHRQIDNVFVIEQRLETMIRELLITKEYVEFLIGRDGEFDQLVASTVRRCKRVIRDDNAFLIFLSVNNLYSFISPWISHVSSATVQAAE